MTQRRLIDYRDRDEYFRCILNDASPLSQLSLFPFGYSTLSPEIPEPTVGVITVQTASDHLQARTGSNYNVIDVTRDPKV